MASSIKLYTTGSLMADATIEATSGHAFYHGEEFLLDNYPDTYWEQSAVGAFNIDIDLGSAKAVDGIAFTLRNANQYSTLIYWQAYYSDDASSWTQIGTNKLFASSGATHTPVRSAFDYSGSTHRYWRITCDTTGTYVAKISNIWLVKYYPILQGSEYPASEVINFNNQIISPMSAAQYSIAKNHNKYIERKYSFVFVNSTDWTNLKNAFIDSCGSRWPFIYVDKRITTEESEYGRVANFSRDFLDANETAYQLFRPTIYIREWPIILASNGY